MDLQPLFQWFEGTSLGTVVRQSLWLFPVIECVHLLGLALLGGTVLVVDMRMLGLGLRSHPTAGLARKLHPWMVASLLTLIFTGIPMFLSEAIKCYFSPPFWYKMGLLILATTFALTVRRKVALAEPGRVAPALVRLTAVLSLALWFGVGFAGRWIAFY
ncbi:MAG: hypothetical protein HYZ37_06920 [Candidatus Solibacter usitatus]|nr:hypothetical protein [Candidatus Solibacter usitatus]